MLSNAYFLAKFRFDTAENEPAKNLQNFRKMHFEVNRGPRPNADFAAGGPKRHAAALAGVREALHEREAVLRLQLRRAVRSSAWVWVGGG